MKTLTRKRGTEHGLSEKSRVLLGVCFAKRYFGCKNRYFGAVRPAWPGSINDRDEARDVFGVAGVAATIGVATVGAAGATGAAAAAAGVTAAAIGVAAVIDIITTGVTVL